jgi:hypothetical protein
MHHVHLEIMNLSHYEPVNPDRNHRHGEKRVEAGRETFPADDQAAVLVRWHQANVRSAWKRGTTLVRGRPRGLLVFPTRVGIGGRIPRRRKRWRRSLAS